MIKKPFTAIESNRALVTTDNVEEMLMLKYIEFINIFLIFNKYDINKVIF